MPKLQRVADIVDLRIARFDAIISSKVIAHTIAQKENLNIQTGQIMELFCTAHGRPLPEINWFKDGSLVTSKSASSNFMISKFGSTSSLRIADVKTSDSGTYACRAENINGHIRKWVFVTVFPKINVTTKYSKIPNNSKSQSVHKSPCDKNPCKVGACLEKGNGTGYECKCPFPYNGNMCENNVLVIGNKRNYSAFEEKAMNCNTKNNVTVNDQLFTIFETILVCIIASLFLGIACYIFRRKFCCFLNKPKAYHNRNSKTIQVEINNFILVRDVGINVNGHIFEHGCDRLMPVPYKRNSSMSFQDPRLQDISQYSRGFPLCSSQIMTPMLYEETIQTNQYSPYLQSILHDSVIPNQSVYFNRSVIHDSNFDSSSEGLNISTLKEHSKSESGICSFLDFNPHMHPLTSKLLIFNEPVSTSLYCTNPMVHINIEPENILM